MERWTAATEQVAPRNAAKDPSPVHEFSSGDLPGAEIWPLTRTRPLSRRYVSQLFFATLSPCFPVKMSGLGVKRVTPFTDHRQPEASPQTQRRLTLAGRRGRIARLVLILLFLVFMITFGGAAIAPWLFSADALSRSATGQLQSSSGLFVMARGPTRLALTPRPRIVMKDVAFADMNGALVIETPELNCLLNLGRLLAGRVQISALTLFRPRATIDADKGRIVAPGAAMRASLTRPETPEAQQADAARLGLVNIVDGALTIKRRNGDQIFDRITVSLDWPRIGQPAMIAGGVDWRGDRHEAMMWIARPGLLLRDEQSFVAARLDGKNLNFEAQGVASLGEHVHFSGRLASRAAAAREALKLFDINPLIPGALQDAEFSAETDIDGNEARFKDLRLRVDGNVLNGVAEFRRLPGKLALSAELTSPFVTIEPLLADLPAMLTSDGQWSREPLELPNLRDVDLNLRLEAAHARLGRLTVDNGGLSVLVHDGALNLALTQAKAYGGRMTAQARITPLASDSVAVHGVAHAEKIDAAGFLWDVFGQQRISGDLDADIALDAKGAHVDAMMRDLAGQANFAFAGGDIDGVDFSRALKLLATNPLASAHAARSGRSRLATASTTITLANGQGVVASGVGKGEDYALSLSGVINVPERTLSLKTIATEHLSKQTVPDDQRSRIVFDLTGGWDDPVWRPDPQNFILRSGAAATLLPQAEGASPSVP